MFHIVDPTLAGGIILVTLFFGILLALRIGRRIGEQVISRKGASALANLGSLEAAVFALLGLLIAFTFSGALARLDVRRAQVVDEANAIGTAYIRIDLLPVSVQPRLRQTFRDYVDSRIATYRKLPDLEAAQQELVRSQKLQAEIWAQAVAATGMPDSRPGTNVLVIPALNQMFDITTTRLVATQIHPPMIIYAMVIVLALASALLGGYHSAGADIHDWLHQIAFAGIIAFTVYVIIDIEYPRAGWVRIDAIDQVLISLRAGMNL
jgi:hypothetical protein